MRGSPQANPCSPEDDRARPPLGHRITGPAPRCPSPRQQALCQTSAAPTTETAERYALKPHLLATCHGVRISTSFFSIPGYNLLRPYLHDFTVQISVRYDETSRERLRQYGLLRTSTQ